MLALRTVPERNDTYITAWTEPGLRSLTYSSNSVNLTVSIETDFLADGAVYQTNSDPAYAVVPNYPHVNFGLGFCNGTDALQWSNLLWDPTLAALFPISASDAPTAPISKKLAKANKAVAIAVPIVVVVVVLAALGAGFYFYRQRSALERDSRRAVASSSIQHMHSPQPSQPQTVDSGWSKARTPTM